MDFKVRRILSPVRLPISPPGQLEVPAGLEPTMTELQSVALPTWLWNHLIFVARLVYYILCFYATLFLYFFKLFFYIFFKKKNTLCYFIVYFITFLIFLFDLMTHETFLLTHFHHHLVMLFVIFEIFHQIFSLIPINMFYYLKITLSINQH